MVGRTTFAVEIDETSLINTILQILPQHAILIKQLSIIQGDLPQQGDLQFKVVEDILSEKRRLTVDVWMPASPYLHD